MYYTHVYQKRIAPHASRKNELHLQLKPAPTVFNGNLLANCLTPSDWVGDPVTFVAYRVKFAARVILPEYMNHPVELVMAKDVLIKPGECARLTAGVP